MEEEADEKEKTEEEKPRKRAFVRADAAVTENWLCEEVKPRLPQNIREPTKQMIIDHEASGHAVFRSWCPHCIAGKGQSNPHIANKEPSEIP